MPCSRSKINKNFEGAITLKTVVNNFNRMELICDDSGEPAMMFLSDDVIMKFPLTNVIEIHYCNQFLESLNTGLTVEFKTYAQYSKLICDCSEILNERGN